MPSRKVLAARWLRLSRVDSGRPRERKRGGVVYWPCMHSAVYLRRGGSLLGGERQNEIS